MVSNFLFSPYTDENKRPRTRKITLTSINHKSLRQILQTLFRQSSFQPILGFAILQAPSLYLSDISMRSRPICSQLQMGTIFEPSISCHSTATSVTGSLSASAMYSISTSKAQRSTCRAAKTSRADFRVSNLKPHCVSWTFFTQKNQTRKWKPCINSKRNRERLAFSSSSRWAREPQIIACDDAVLSGDVT